MIRSVASFVRRRPLLARAALRLVPDLKVSRSYPALGRFEFRLRRNRAFWLRDPEDFERIPFAMLACLVRPGDVVADLGANLGLYSRFLVSGAGAARVLAFEPWIENTRMLRRNLELGSMIDRVEIHPIAVADEDGEFRFQVDDIQSASGSLDRVRHGSPSEGRENLGLPVREVTVPCRTLDSLVSSGQIPQPDVLKIDVEGAETLVLRGARALLVNRRPRILVELHGASEARSVLEILLGHEYRIVAHVEPSLSPSGFSPLTASDLSRIRGRYDVHFMAASCDGGLPTVEALRALSSRSETRRAE